jgi:hypothetical protein
LSAILELDSNMVEWLEFLVFVVAGLWLLVAAGFIIFATVILGGRASRQEVFFCLALIVGGSTFLWGAYRDAPFQIELRSAHDR